MMNEKEEEEMSELSETIESVITKPNDEKVNSKIAILVAITATFMALCNVKDGNIVQAMSQAQAHSIDAWAYYQAKSTKQFIAENTLDTFKMNPKSASADLLKKYEDRIKQYEKEKNEIKIKAEGFQKEYEDLNVFDDQFDMTDAFLSIAIALFGITALTQKKWLFYFSCGLSGIGIFYGLAAFFQVSLHSEWMAKILG